MRRLAADPVPSGDRVLKISVKLPAIIVGLSLMCSAVVGIASYATGASTVQSLSEERLTALAENRKSALEDYLAGLQSGLVSFADSKTVLGALAGLSGGWSKAGDQPAQRAPLCLFFRRSQHAPGHALPAQAFIQFHHLPRGQADRCTFLDGCTGLFKDKIHPGGFSRRPDR